MSARLLPGAVYKAIDARAPWGVHVPARPRAALYVVVRGGGRLEVDGAPALALTTEDIAFVAPGRAHTLRDAVTSAPVLAHDPPACDAAGPAIIGGTGAPTTLVIGWFELADGASAFARADRVTLVPANVARPWVAGLIDLVRAELATPSPASDLLLRRLADVLLVQALRAAMSRAMSDATACGAATLDVCVSSDVLAHPPIHRALELLHARLDAPWTVEQLAARVGLSRSGFATQFARAMGEPPLRYLARARIARAAQLLRETEASIADIAERVGYESVPSFGKAFKRWRGASPAAYRTRR